LGDTWHYVCHFSDGSIDVFYAGPPPILDRKLLVEENKETFCVKPIENLEVKSPIDIKCDVFELETGKLIIKNAYIDGNGSYQVISMEKYNNKPYLIQFKLNDQVVYQQSFYFSNNSSNSIIIGGSNE